LTYLQLKRGGVSPFVFYDRQSLIMSGTLKKNGGGGLKLMASVKE
jgi:hypothetical protein